MFTLLLSEAGTHHVIVSTNEVDNYLEGRYEYGKYETRELAQTALNTLKLNQLIR
jgi:hypothetical protein